MNSREHRERFVQCELTTMPHHYSYNCSHNVIVCGSLRRVLGSALDMMSLDLVNMVVEYGSGAQFVRSFPLGTDIDEPRFVAVSPEREVYVSHRKQVRVFSEQGEHIRQLLISSNPRGLVFSARGELCVAEYLQSAAPRVNIFGKGARFLGSVECERDSDPSGIARDRDGTLLLVDRFMRSVLRLHPQCGGIARHLFSFSHTGLTCPHSVAVGAAGQIYISDCTASGSVYVITENGKFVQRIGRSSDDGLQPLSFPSGIALDSNGNLYVCDAGNKRIQVFDASGAFSWSFTVSTGAAGDQLGKPVSICLDSHRYCYVLDESNHRVCVFALA